MNQDPEGGYRKYGHPAETITLAALAAVAAEAILPATGLPGWTLPAVEIIAACGGGIVTWSFTGRKTFPVYMAGLGTFLGGWTTWAGSVGLWHWSTFSALLAGMAVMIPWGISAWHRRQPAVPAPLMLSVVPEPLMLEAEPDEHQVQMDKFHMTFTDLNPEFEHVEVTALSEERAGRVVRMNLPLSGKVTIEDFRVVARRLEVVLEAQEGAVTFQGGSTSREVIMKIRERDGLADTCRLTPELRAKSVNEEFVIGMQEDGSYLRISVREHHFMIIGIMGSGKSNLINVLIAQLANCVDSVIWMIDMKEGRAGKPWFQAWSEGRAEAPPIDWLATDRAEAELMMQAVTAGIDVRSKSGIGMNKIIPNSSRPQVVFVCDEMADLFGDNANGTRSQVGESAQTNTWFMNKGERATQKGRSEAFTTFWASQRGTNGMSGTGDMKGNIDVSIALKPKKYSDLQYIIPDAPALAGRQLSYLAETPGVGMVGIGPNVSQITKFLHHDHIEGTCGTDENNPRCPAECPVYQTQLATGSVRPRLDRMTAQALGSSYAQRWVRAKEKGVLRVPPSALSGGSAVHGERGDGDSSRFEDVIKGLADPEKELHPAKVRMLEFLASRGVMGASPQMTMEMLKHEGIAPARETLHRWFRECRDEELIHHPDYRRGVAGPGRNVEGE